ncbi:MAG: TlyA family RNA methyltransferase [Myxococcales bacterium]|nr:TlyA family RNA methyltransferase [Myxococcales bacterium]MCB9731378.1 TlyA family RNA methyltransferase [Deltaproteobacteria bacterium]
MTPARPRLDALLVDRGLVESEAHAQGLILAGKVFVRGQRVDKAGTRVADDAPVEVREDHGWASRGAFKLLGALEAFPWLAERVRGADCLDVGASTGGFTDVLLRHGAARVIALDVGYGILHWRLRSDARVVVMDRTNIRTLEPGALPFAPSVATCDASFISVRSFLDVVFRELAPGGVFVVLVKPQFELGREEVPDGGVVSDEAARVRALEDVAASAVVAGFTVRGHAESPLSGPRGNREWLLALEKVA